MLNSKDLIKDVKGLLIDRIDDDEPYVIGYGLCTSTVFGFDEDKLDAKKKDIANILHQTGVDEHPLTSLRSFTKFKDGTIWNKLESEEDFCGLDHLIACASACGFIYNGPEVQQLNINTMGEINSIAISQYRGVLLGSSENWLKVIREVALDKMLFPVNAEAINKALSETSTKKPGSLQ